MADGFNATEGSGKLIDTDEVSRGGQTVHEQVIKVAMGADGVAVLLGNGQQTKVASLPVTFPSDPDPVPVSPRSTVVPVTPTISSGSAYAAGDQIGGIQNIAAALLTSLTGMLVDVSVVDKDSQNQGITILFFSASPTVVSNDNDPADIADSELAGKFIGAVTVSALDYVSLAHGSIATKECGLTLKSASTSVYAVAVIHGAATFTSTSGLVFSYHIQQD